MDLKEKEIVRFDTYEELCTSKLYLNEINHKGDDGLLNYLLNVKVKGEVALFHCLNQNVIFIRNNLSKDDLIEVISDLVGLIRRDKPTYKKGQ